MTIRLYLIEAENDNYNIVESVHITKHLNQLDKYSTHTIHPKYKQYNIREDFKSHQTIFQTDNNVLYNIKRKYWLYKNRQYLYTFKN